MLRSVFLFPLVFSAVPIMASADTDKDVVCGHQGDIATAVQDARLDGVRESNVEKTLRASDPSWPDNFSKAIPAVTIWIYGMDMALVKENDLGDFWKQECLKNWDAIQKSLNQ